MFGGIIGISNNITNNIKGELVNYGNIIGEIEIGGIWGYGCFVVIGKDEKGVVKNHGDVKGTNNVGGIIGHNQGNEMIDNNSFVNAINYGNVEGTEKVGGIIGEGYNNIYNNCINIGNVKGITSVGGIIGNIENIDNMNNLYNIGSVIGEDQVGGIFGKVDYFISNCNNIYSLGKVTANSNGNAILGKIIEISDKTEFMKYSSNNSNIYYLPSVATQGTEFGNVTGMESRDFTISDVLQDINSKIKQMNESGLYISELLEWKITDGKADFVY